MCGICGVIANGVPVPKQEISRMTETLKHRGPDDCGYFLNARVAFGHRRLSIIDLSHNGRQPMTNEDATIQLVFNGEIYNHLDLRADLEKQGKQIP